MLPTLAAAVRLGIAVESAKPLLEGAVRWLLAQRLRPGQGSCFPSWSLADNPPEPSRLGWCYGDPGISTQLFLAAHLTDRSDWEEAALTVARRAAGRRDETTRIHDACLC